MRWCESIDKYAISSVDFISRPAVTLMQISWSFLFWFLEHFQTISCTLVLFLMQNLVFLQGKLLAYIAWDAFSLCCMLFVCHECFVVLLLDMKQLNEQMAAVKSKQMNTQATVSASCNSAVESLKQTTQEVTQAISQSVQHQVAQQVSAALDRWVGSTSAYQ